MVIIALIFLCGCNSGELSGDQSREIDQYNAELKLIDREIEIAEAELVNYPSGLIGTLISTRIEINRISRDIINQKILSIKSGVKFKYETIQYKTNEKEANNIAASIDSLSAEIQESRNKIEPNSSGLIRGMEEAAIAMENLTLSMLKQQYMINKHGLNIPYPNNIISPENKIGIPKQIDIQDTSNDNNILANGILSVRILKKELTKQDYQEYIFCDFEFKAIGLDKPARAIKGILNFQDIFGETKLRVNATLNDPISPGGKFVEYGLGFEYNKFNSEHRWISVTNIKDLKVTFTVMNILYNDGSQWNLF